MTNLKAYLQKNDSWVFLALFFVLSAERAINTVPHSWAHYLSCLGTFLLCYTPILLFIYFRQRLKQSLSQQRYFFLWGLFFLILPATIAWLSQNSISTLLSYFGNGDYFIVMAFILPGLDLGLALNRYLVTEVSSIDWLKKIGIDGTILISILFFSFLLSMMAVSNQAIFEKDELIVPSIELGQVIRHFFLVVAYALQFMLIYLSLYFFYVLNNKLLIPTLLKKRGLLIYGIGVGGSIALFFPLLAQLLVSLPLVQQTSSLMPSQNLTVFTELNALLPFIVILISLPVIVALQWFSQNNEITKLEKQQVESELGLLKQQINPHFFFNTLNNLYSLSLAKSDQTPDVIVQLSELMRYVIYKGREKEVLLSEELKYIEDYIQLQQIRLHKSFDLVFEHEVEDDHFLIPPLLLIILIENAFKHGIEPAERECFLHIQLQQRGNHLSFVCKNSFDRPESEDKGIGLDNLRRRLSLRFPEQHELTILEEGDTFIANLAIWKTPA